MANVSEWSANEKDNLFLDELNLSDQHGRRTAKIMAAVKAKEDEQDAKLDAVAGGLVFRGTKADYAALEAVSDPAVGDMYSVTALGGENYAWNGEAWDSLGTSDSNVVHKTGDEIVAGKKTFSSDMVLGGIVFRPNNTGVLLLRGGNGNTNAPVLSLLGGEHPELPGYFRILARTSSENFKMLEGRPDGTLTWDGDAIQTTSDARLKTEIAAVPDAVLDAWENVGWLQFRFLTSVGQKGSAARLHLGVTAQGIAEAFEAHGLDACQYGILCHEQREAAADDMPAADTWMVRYAEALAMEAAYQRRRADRLEARVAALEARLGID